MEEAGIVIGRERSTITISQLLSKWKQRIHFTITKKYNRKKDKETRKGTERKSISVRKKADGEGQKGQG